MGPERRVEDIVADLEKTRRRVRPFLILGLLIIVASLIASIVVLENARREAVWSRDAAQAELRKFQAAEEVIARAKAAPPERRGQILEAGLVGIQQAAAPQRPPQVKLEEMEVRIWICNGAAPENRLQAEALRKLRPAGANGRWRRDYLTAELNARPTFRLGRNEIRYNPTEEDAADRLQRMIREGSGMEALKVLTFFPSPNSISVFFCQGANPPPLSAEQGPSASAATTNAN